MLLDEARRAARLDADGSLVLLRDQDRSRWDRETIREGVELVGQALRRTPDVPDPYVAQAAIAACHDLAPTWEQTDWSAILSWYDVLLTVADTPVARLNRAVAIAELRGPEHGLTALEQIASAGLAGYPPLAATRAELLARAGRDAEARAAYDQALALTTSGPVHAHLARRRGLLPG